MCKTTKRKIWARDVVRFDLWPLLQGQTQIAKFEIAYNLLIIGHRGLKCESNL